MGHSIHDPAFAERRPWNTGRTPGAKRALKPQQIWAIRFWLDRERRMRDRALFDLAIDSKLRGCDLVRIRIRDLISGAGFEAVPSSFRQRPAGRSNSSCWSPRAAAYWPGLSAAEGHWRTSRFPAEPITLITSAPGNMRAWSMNG
jgi:hypothetical protein